ncbi:XrtA-associated tyrosine autokinase [Duganella sp. Root1480D1]|uniref:XrtA-associated tyrosine autokinase n=1 Tax=Duganella sp. Root1480D1 TaxID=1736471 RepID=UPI00070B83A7|nr:XrtA-associated tyrosine autokinase [Duganella sp. Root1480D1]KQZ25985.1 protein tyrosine kinase [Duganella sp. Root1480D1]
MSIIEKAANRLGHPRPADAAAEAIIPPAPAAAPVAEAVHAAPAAAAPAAAPAPAAAAPLAAAPAPAPAVPAAPVAAPVVSGMATLQPHGDASRRTTHTVELDLMRMHESGLVTAAGGRTALVEDFRIIKRPLIKRAFAARKPGDNPGNLIMITSSLPGEGKTFCAINLAMSIAMELDHTVLLVDADVARPSVLRTLGLPAQRGLMDILLDDNVDMADVMLRTNVNTLSILPAGTSSPRATELLASHMMKNLVNEIANRYPDRIVIFDSPPLLLTSESHVLASNMGQIVMVVESERTTQHAVKESLRQLEGLSNVNLIYNKSREFPGTETYDYHYG